MKKDRHLEKNRSQENSVAHGNDGSKLKQQLTGAFKMRSTIFNFSGSAQFLTVRCRLVRKGILAEDVPGRRGDVDPTAFDVIADEMRVSWSASSGNSPFVQREVSRENRLSVVTDQDQLPDHLKKFGKDSSEDEVARNLDPNNWKASTSTSTVVYKKEFKAPRNPSSRRIVYLLAFLGQQASSETERDLSLVCRLTIIDDSKLIVEPALNPEGYRLESKFGDYDAQVEICDTEFEEPSTAYRSPITSIAEMETFILPRENITKTTICLTIVEAEKFPFEGLSFEYEIELPKTAKLLSGSTKGQTHRSFRDQNGLHLFSSIVEVGLECEDSDEWPLIMFRAESYDGWGRRITAGFGSAHLPVTPGSHKLNLEMWRPLEANDKSYSLKELFIGSHSNIDYFAMMKQGGVSQFRLETTSSGLLHLETNVVVQSRRLMARDQLYQLKYGAKMANIGLRSEFYQKIVRILFEFEEARSKILLVRALRNKNSITKNS
ncbi:unnamed protein product [Caenorhabditis auriculariae]|uniref:Uncharacterized protein n=1 Tax=Caenorhabditis auriculariae TaxID=2777116 RepID=A0A8S1HC39_9PELO|nr:unnamed protein product [Caenorhabditis auriculariae]